MQIEEAQTHIFSAEDALLAAEEGLTRTRHQADTAQEKVKQEERALHQAQMEAQSLQQRFQAAEQEIIAWNARQDALQQRQMSLQLEERNNEEENAVRRQEKLQQLSGRNDELDAQLKILENERAAQQEKSAQARDEAKKIEDALPAARENQQKAILSVQQAQLTAERHQQILSERGADIAFLSEDANHGISVGELNQNIVDYARQLNNLGAVNLAAAEELAQIDGRRDYLSQQRKDLENAIDLLQQAIIKIDKESERLFQETFEKADNLMQHYFPVLFGGGQAKLVLEGNDLLSSGVSITARPPGKKNTTIHLLSGGEKTLTAMSLVFSLFSLNPAPFCLLDEVDAPLDDANTARFCRLVEEMSAKTQFLYISHNRLTMETAEQLIGVTMQEKGVSRIVSVDIQAALNMAEK